jgi:hypothetical protein
MMPSLNRTRVIIVAFFLLFSLLLLQSSVKAAYHEEENDDEYDCVLDEDGETCLPSTITHPNFVATESMDTADEHLYKKGPSPSLVKKDEL